MVAVICIGTTNYGILECISAVGVSYVIAKDGRVGKVFARRFIAFAVHIVHI